MKLLIDIEGPGTEMPVPGEPSLVSEIEAFTRRLVESRVRSVRAQVTVLTIDPNWVLVDANQLHRLQKRAEAKK